MSIGYTTRSGRAIKKPVVYVPQEVPEDDFAEDDYDETDAGGENCDDDDDNEDDNEDEDEDEDADENGNLAGFIVDDESDESDCD